MDKVFQIESLEDFQNATHEIITNLFYSGCSVPDSPLEDDVISLAKQEIVSVISDCNFDLQKLKEYISCKGWPQEKVSSVNELIDSSKSDILYAAFNNYNSSYCETVINFDWLLKYVLGTSEMKTFKYPLLQLMLATIIKQGKQNKVMYDINKDMLLKLITALQTIK